MLRRQEEQSLEMSMTGGTKEKNFYILELYYLSEMDWEAINNIEIENMMIQMKVLMDLPQMRIQANHKAMTHIEIFAQQYG